MSPSTKTAGESARKPSQRERLLDAMIELSARVGYHDASIALVSTRAGVSRSTFYEQFPSREDCMLAAYELASERVVGAAGPIGAGGDWGEVAWGALDVLLDGARRNPAAASVMLVEARAAGAQVRERRRLTVEELEGRIEALLDSTASGEQTLDIPALAIVGGVRAILTRHLRTQAEDELPAQAASMLAWMASYAIDQTEGRWSSGPLALIANSAPPNSAPTDTVTPADAPTRLPRGNHRLPAGVVARSHRLRIIYATAEVVMEKGYTETTVAAIVASAGVAREVFYEHFENKQHAFLEAQQHSTQDILDACAAAYFAAEDWPRRVWNCLGTLIALIAANPALANLRLVEYYAAGPPAIRRAEDITRSFTLFIEEGYHYRPQAARLPHLCSQAITGAIFEALQRAVAARQTAELHRQLPQLVYIAIAPFTGAARAKEIVQEIAARDALPPSDRADAG